MILGTLVASLLLNMQEKEFQEQDMVLTEKESRHKMDF